MDTVSGSRAHDRLAEIRSSLEPKLVRAQAISALDDLFRSGYAPDQWPEGWLRGELITTSITRPLDGAVRVISSLYMPWLGKRFDPGNQTGVNVLKPSARPLMKTLWPNYEPEEVFSERIEAFPFRNRVGPGEVDPSVQVLKIDYDFPPNPDLLIRRILDELVQLEERLYLGKILFRRNQGWRPIGFFSLHG